MCQRCRSSLVGRGFLTEGPNILCPDCGRRDQYHHTDNNAYTGGQRDQYHHTDNNAYTGGQRDQYHHTENNAYSGGQRSIANDYDKIN